MIQDPAFLTKEQVDALHDYQLKTHGGQPGTRDENLLESAVVQPQHVHFYGQGDHYDVAAAYAYHIAENQPYIDGNKRTGVQAATLYLQANGIETKSLSNDKMHDMMISVANKTATRDDIAEHFRTTLSPEQKISASTQSQLAPPQPENPYQKSSPEPMLKQDRPSNPYKRTEPQPERKPDQPTNPYKRPGIDDDTGHRH